MEYTRYRYKLVSCRSSEKNRYQNALAVLESIEGYLEQWNPSDLYKIDMPVALVSH